MRNLPVVLVAAALVAGGACGGGDGAFDGTVSCSISESAADGTVLQLCEEITGVTSAEAQQVEQGCNQTLKLPADAGVSAKESGGFGPCSRTHALGGCKVVEGAQT